MQTTQNGSYAALDESGRGSLHRELHQLLARFNRGNRGALVVPSEYLELVIRRA